MGHRLDRWRALAWRDKGRLLACAAGLWVLHAGLACFGYGRMRQFVERHSRHPAPRPASAADLTAARALAVLAAMAGNHALPGDATCLRRALLVHGWLRRRGLRPALQLGVREEHTGPFQAHAWVELEGAPLMESDAGYRPFAPSSATQGSHPA